MRARKIAYQKNNQNRFAMILVTCIVVILAAVVGFQSLGLKNELSMYQAELDQINEQIESEQQRSIELEELETYTKTKKYQEQIAREKIGFVREGEIVFKEGN